MFKETYNLCGQGYEQIADEEGNMQCYAANQCAADMDAGYDCITDPNFKLPQGWAMEGDIVKIPAND